jgi:hypothetical protein
MSKIVKARRSDVIDHIDVRPMFGVHPYSDQEYHFWRAIVTTKRGYCYYVTYGDHEPTEDEVRQAWRNDYQSFDPWIS